MLKRFLPLWLTLLSLLALIWPRFSLPFDPFVDPKNAIPYFLEIIFALAMFGIGTLLPKAEIDQLLKRWPYVFLGAAAQYTVMPALAWSLAKVSNLSTDLQIGLILAGCVPGAMASNVLTLQARGNVSYSVCLTTTTTILSPVVVPLLLMLCLGSLLPASELDLEKAFDPVKVGVNLLLTVALPVVGGHLSTRFSSRMKSLSERFSETFANLAILWIIAVVVALNRQRFAVDAQIVTILLALNLLGYLAGYGIGKVSGLDEPMRRALTIEVGMQNAGLGSVLAVSLFPDRLDATIPTVAYMFGCMLTGTILAVYWRNRSTGAEATDANAAPIARS